MNPNHIGDVTEATIVATLLKRGERVLRPVSPSSRYDLVIEREGRFLRVQCKTGRLRNGAITFRTCNGNGSIKSKARRYDGEVDIFAVYCPDNDKCYLIAAEHSTGMQMSLRADTARNNQQNGVRYARDFEF